MEKPEYKLEQQDPKRDELLEKEAKSERLNEELRQQIENATEVSELENVIFNSDNQALISKYSKFRFAYLKDHNTFMEGDEAKLNNLELESYVSVDDNGYLEDANGVTTAHIEHQTDRKNDADFIPKVQAELLPLFDTSL